VEARHQVTAGLALDHVAGHVHGDVPHADAGADDEQHRAEDHQVRGEGEGRVGEAADHDAHDQHRPGPDRADQPAGERHREQRPDRGEQQGEPEPALIGPEVVPHGG
jgi:hypothetical protein